MVINLNEQYNLGRKIVVLAFTEKTFSLLKNGGYEIVFFAQNNIIFYPEEFSMEISESTKSLFLQCNEYDVFLILENGKAYRYYNNSSDDNAFMLTAHCNSNCLMCPATDALRKKDSTATVDEIIKIIHFLPNTTKHITITGGEPFLIGERIFEIFKSAKENLKNTNFQLLTNGRALCIKSYVQKLKETAPKKIYICVPIHGSDSQTHDSITRVSGSFEQTKLGIKNLLHYGFNVEIRIVVSKLNSSDITNIAKMILNEFIGISSVKIMGLEMLGNAAKNEENVWIPYPEAFIASKKAIDLFVKNSIDVCLYNFPLCSIEKPYRYIAAKSITDYKIRFDPNCELCQLKDACGGIFAGTIRLAKKDIVPII